MNANWSRRDFLKTASAATLSTLAAGYARPLLAADSTEPKIAPTADTVIILWMAGGMAHTETFDPKRYTPFEKGMDPSLVLSTFPSIDTSVNTLLSPTRTLNSIGRPTASVAGNVVPAGTVIVSGSPSVETTNGESYRTTPSIRTADA